ncbi:ATP-binding protein [Intestinibacter bartlettii]|uniref:ATP-binding protein n=1 Tax=Intestinibacter bartlettii TaxID=261299 RepID=UPI00319E160D
MSSKRSAEATIAGYLYQFDKSIIEILNFENDYSQVTIEGIEDIDIEDEDFNLKSIQVKYYEGTEYNHSQISEAVRYLFFNYIDYLNGNTKRREYYVYGHYYSGTEKLKVNEDFTIQDIDGKKAIDIVKENFLTYNSKKEGKKEFYLEKNIKYRDEDDNEIKRSITDEELEDFISLLKININAKSIDEQYEELLLLLEERVDNCKSREDAENYYYNNALNVVFNLAKSRDESSIDKEKQINSLNKKKTSLKGKIERRLQHENPEKLEEVEKYKNELEELKLEIDKLCDEIEENDKKKRTITKKEFIKKIDKKIFLFNKWYAANLGKMKYTEYIRDNLYKRKSLNRTKSKFLILGKEFKNDLTNYENLPIYKFLKLVIEDSYKIDTAFANKDKPWTIVLDIESEEYQKILNKLFKHNIKINTGKEEYKFDIDAFNEEPIINANRDGTISRASYQIKLITLSTFKENIQEIEDIDVTLFFMRDNCDEYLEELNSRGVYSYVVDSRDITTLEDIEFLFENKNIYKDYFRILNVSPTLLQIEVIKPQKFKNLNENFTLGSYIKITDENNNSIIGILKSYKIKEINNKDDLSIKKINEPSFILDVQPVGHITDNEFKKGNKSITIPPSRVEIANEELLKEIFYIKSKDKEFCIGDLAQNPTINGERINVTMDGNKFFNKHLAVVGSTGSGKSCTVAKILQEGIKPYTQNQKEGILNNSHVILFDLHGEYRNAFKEECRYLEAENLKLPYWLMNSEELQEYFLDVEGSDHNQRNIFKKAITLNKKWHNLNEKEGQKEINDNITYDSSVYFSISEILCCIENYNRAREKDGIYTWKYSDNENDTEIKDIMPQTYNELEQYSKLFMYRLEPVNEKGTRQANLNFTNFISRLENKIHDDRLTFLLQKGNKYNIELADVIKQFIGYNTTSLEENKNITIIDLSGMPFEVVNIVVALVSRLIFKFAFERKRVMKMNQIEEVNEVPFLLVYEEAHNYIPKSQEVKYKSVKEAVERIAKEGRKYGVSAMIVSQRPSEISETIFSQCNSFVVMRLTNPVDQNYIKKMLPEDISSITDNISGFDKREALILGDSVKIPALIKIHELDSDRLPKSNDINFIQEWRKDWNEMDEFDRVISLMSKKC